MTNPIWRSRAAAMTNGKFISIETLSGYRLAIFDPAGEDRVLLPDDPDEVLGRALLGALSQSRHLALGEAEALRASSGKYYSQTLDRLMEQFGYKNREKLFKKMLRCFIDSFDGVITIKPSNHEELQGWTNEGIDRNDYVNLPVDSSPAEVGAGLRLAFSRCIG